MLKVGEEWKSYAYDAVDRQMEGHKSVVWCKAAQKRGRGMLMVIWTAGLDVPRHTTPDPSEVDLLQRPEVGQAKRLGVMGQVWSFQCLHMPIAPATLLISDAHSSTGRSFDALELCLLDSLSLLVSE